MVIQIPPSTNHSESLNTGLMRLVPKRLIQSSHLNQRFCLTLVMMTSSNIKGYNNRFTL